MTKTQFLDALSEPTGLQRKDVASVLDQRGVVIERHVKNGGITHEDGVFDWVVCDLLGRACDVR